MTNPLTVYKASAGSGKTFRLALEYIKLLVLAPEGGEFAHILAVTFTNKATAEMKDRIISQLYGIAHGLDSSRPYRDELWKAMKDEPNAPANDDELQRRCGQALHQILHNYSRFRVETIDSFFQTILRGLAHELGLTANLQVEINDAEVLSQAVDRIIDRLQEEPVVLDWLLSLVRDQIDNNQRWDVTRRVKEFGRAIFNEDYLRRGDQLRSVLSNGPLVRKFISDLRQQESDAISIAVSYGNQIDETIHQYNLDYSDFSYGTRVLTALVNKLKSGAVTEIENTTNIEKWADDPMKMVKVADANRSEVIEAADIISGVLSELLSNLDKLKHIINSSRLALAHIKPLFLLDFINREVAEINAETSRFNLAKTPILLSRMIGESDAPFVFEKIGALLHHVMIDEFQDTSRLQWENFRALLLESYSRGGRNLIVGDVKQSIYRGRGGDWRILGDIKENLLPTPKVKTLDVNRRSFRRIVNFNSTFFDEAHKLLDRVSQSEEQELQLPDFFARAYADVVQQVPKERRDEGFIRARVFDGKELPLREDWEPMVLEDLCNQVRELHAGGLPFNKMAILVRHNSDCEPIVQAFAEVPDMPPIVSDEAFLLSSCLPVCLLVESVRYLVEENPLARFYLEEHDVDAQLLADQRESLLLTPLYELLEQLYRQLGLQRFTGQDAYLFGFYDAVGEFLRNEAADLTSFLVFWDETLSRQSVPASEVDGIRILSIHKSKGLEFHTVLLPFCSWDFERDRKSSLMWCTPTEEPYSDLQLLPVTPSAKTAPHSVFARDYSEAHLLSRMDELNALYVAFTRARANLLIWCVGSDLERDGRTVGDLIACAVPEVANETETGLFVIGEPVHTFEQGTASQENRMELVTRALPLSMSSYDLSVQFRQSNQSAEFISRQSGGEEPTQEERTQRRYLETGRLLHRVLQSIRVASDVVDVLNDFERQGLISRIASDGTEVAVPRAHMERWVQQGLRNPKVADWFRPEWQLFNECSIVSLNDSQQPVVHRPDRVMISADGRHIIVVDFKFGSMHAEYEQQVLEYMDLLRQMSPLAEVEGYLWFVYSGKVHRVGAPGSSSNTPRFADPSQLTIDF